MYYVTQINEISIEFYRIAVMFEVRVVSYIENFRHQEPVHALFALFLMVPSSFSASLREQVGQFIQPVMQQISRARYQH